MKGESVDACVCLSPQTMKLQEQYELARWQQVPRHERSALPDEPTLTARVGVCFRVIALDGARPNDAALAACSPKARIVPRPSCNETPV